MTTETILDRVKKVLALDLGIPVDQITTTDKLGKDLDANSLDLSVIQLSLEEEFKLDISDRYYCYMTVQDVADGVTAMLIKEYGSVADAPA